MNLHRELSPGMPGEIELVMGNNDVVSNSEKAESNSRHEEYHMYQA